MVTRSRIALSFFSAASLLLPAVAGAATLQDTLIFLSTFLNGVIGLFITLAIVVFFWGLIKYLWSIDNENAHEGLKIMFWGLICIFVMVSIWGIIRLLQSTLKVTSTDPIIPKGITVSPGTIYRGAE